MKTLLAIIISLQLTAIAIAIPDSAAVEPYAVSFDLGMAKDNYTVTLRIR